VRVCIIATTAPGGHVLRRSDLSTAQLLAHMVKLRHVDSIIQEGHQPTIRYDTIQRHDSDTNCVSCMERSGLT